MKDRSLQVQSVWRKTSQQESGSLSLLYTFSKLALFVSNNLSPETSVPQTELPDSWALTWSRMSCVKDRGREVELERDPSNSRKTNMETNGWIESEDKEVDETEPESGRLFHLH